LKGPGHLGTGGAGDRETAKRLFGGVTVLIRTTRQPGVVESGGGGRV
jgi:hypothetical protein